MNTFKTKMNLLALAAAAMLSVGTGVAANAQDFTRPNADIRALEVPADVTAAQAKPAFYALSYQGRFSAFGGNTERSHADVSTSMSRH